MIVDCLSLIDYCLWSSAHPSANGVDLAKVHRTSILGSDGRVGACLDREEVTDWVV